jgi:enoyl-CoA hydratase
MTTPEPQPKMVVSEKLDDGITIVRLNRPERLNAMRDQLFVDAVEVLDEVAADPECRVAIITGAGRAFSAGGDLDAFDVIDGTKSSVPRTRALFELSSAMILRLQSMPQPVIAAINGPAAGGGFSFALAADTRICSESARFNAAFVRMGLTGCEMGISYLLPRIVGATAAFELMLSGRLIDAAEAFRIGLVLEVVPDDALIDRAIEIAKTMSRNSPIGLALTKEVMWANLSAPSLRDALVTEMHAQMLSGHTEDHREARDAFMEKRTPTFKNR